MGIEEKFTGSEGVEPSPLAKQTSITAMDVKMISLRLQAHIFN